MHLHAWITRCAEQLRQLLDERILLPKVILSASASCFWCCYIIDPALPEPATQNSWPSLLARHGPGLSAPSATTSASA